VGQFWPKVEDDILQTIWVYLKLTTVTLQDSKAIEFCEMKQSKDYYAVQGHLRSPMLAPIERPYAISY